MTTETFTPKAYENKTYFGEQKPTQALFENPLDNVQVYDIDHSSEPNIAKVLTYFGYSDILDKLRIVKIRHPWYILGPNGGIGKSITVSCLGDYKTIAECSEEEKDKISQLYSMQYQKQECTECKTHKCSCMLQKSITFHNKRYEDIIKVLARVIPKTHSYSLHKDLISYSCTVRKLDTEEKSISYSFLKTNCPELVWSCSVASFCGTCSRDPSYLIDYSSDSITDESNEFPRASFPTSNWEPAGMWKNVTTMQVIPMFNESTKVCTFRPHDRLSSKNEMSLLFDIC